MAADDQQTPPPHADQHQQQADTQAQALCLTIFSYRKPGLSAEEYRNYMVHKHALLVGPLLEKYNVLSYTQTHTTPHSLALMQHVTDDPQFANVADYDCVVQLVFRSIGDLIRLKQDAAYRKFVAPDHENFADTKRSRMTIGYVNRLVEGGRMVSG